MAAKDEKEWFLQAESDISAARTLFRGRKYIYAVFMCHLSVEKALKSIYCLQKRKLPPRSHDLLFLSGEIEADLPPDIRAFI